MGQLPDPVWQALIGAVVTIVLAWLQNRTKVATERALVAQDEKLHEISEVGNANHTLLNSNMGAALRLISELSEWKVHELRNLPNVDPVVLKVAEDAAKLARNNYDEHIGKQAVVDGQKEQVDAVAKAKRETTRGFSPRP